MDSSDKRQTKMGQHGTFALEFMESYAHEKGFAFNPLPNGGQVRFHLQKIGTVQVTVSALEQHGRYSVSVLTELQFPHRNWEMLAAYFRNLHMNDQLPSIHVTLDGRLCTSYVMFQMDAGVPSHNQLSVAMEFAVSPLITYRNGILDVGLNGMAASVASLTHDVERAAR